MANVNKYLIQEDELQSYMELTDGEVNVIRHLIDIGFLYSETKIINLTEMEYINPNNYELDSEV